MLEDWLLQIGFSKSCVKVYIELLKIGPQAVSIVGKMAGLNRTTTYSVLKMLEQKGVVSTYKYNNIKYFVANDPNCLIGYLDRKSRTFEYYKDEFLPLIPRFRALKGDCKFTKPVVSHFDGIEGVKSVMHEIIRSKGHLFGYFPLGKWFDHGLKDFLLKYQKKRIDQKTSLKAIVPDTEKVRAFFKKNYKSDKTMTNLLYVSEVDFPEVFKNQVFIYANKVVTICLDKGIEYAVVLESQEIADMQISIFEMAWIGCKVGVSSIHEN